MTILKCSFCGNYTNDLGILSERKELIIDTFKGWEYDAYLRKLNTDLTFEIAIRDNIPKDILDVFRSYFHENWDIETEVLYVETKALK